MGGFYSERQQALSYVEHVGPADSRGLIPEKTTSLYAHTDVVRAHSLQ
jgi:hypothetical protein